MKTPSDPNPKIEEACGKSEQQLQEELDAEVERSERWNRNFNRFVLIPVILLLIGAILWLASLLHWSAGIATTALIIWLSWKLWKSFRH